MNKITKQWLLDHLPHGSEINFDWNIEERKGIFSCYNAWHFIDGNGYYDGIFNFCVKIPINNPIEFKFNFQNLNSKEYYKINGIQLRTYLEELFHFILEPFRKPNFNFYNRIRNNQKYAMVDGEQFQLIPCEFLPEKNFLETFERINLNENYNIR